MINEQEKETIWTDRYWTLSGMSMITIFCLSSGWRGRRDSYPQGDRPDLCLRDALNLQMQAPGHETYVYEPSGMFGAVRLVELG